MCILVPLMVPSGGNQQALNMEVPCLTWGPIWTCINWELVENFEGKSARRSLWSTKLSVQRAGSDHQLCHSLTIPEEPTLRTLANILTCTASLIKCQIMRSLVKSSWDKAYENSELSRLREINFFTPQVHSIDPVPDWDGQLSEMLSETAQC